MRRLTVCAAVGPSGVRCLWKLPLQLCQHPYLNRPLQLPRYSWFLHSLCVITKCFSVVGKPLKIGRVCQFKGTLKVWTSIHSFHNLSFSPHSLYLLSHPSERYFPLPDVSSWISACLPIHLYLYRPRQHLTCSFSSHPLFELGQGLTILDLLSPHIPSSKAFVFYGFLRLSQAQQCWKPQEL